MILHIRFQNLRLFIQNINYMVFTVRIADRNRRVSDIGGTDSHLQIVRVGSVCLPKRDSHIID